MLMRCAGMQIMMKWKRSLIDNNHNPNQWAHSPTGNTGSCKKPLWVTVNLGNYYEVGSVTVWNYYGDRRRYCGQKIALSMTGDFDGEEKVVYDTKGGYGPWETVNGSSHPFPPTVTRYIRYWSAGSTKNKGVPLLWDPTPRVGS
jgi:hypothetical protein